MKKILALVLALCMVLALCACGTKSETPTTTGTAAASKVKIGVILVGDETEGYTKAHMGNINAVTQAGWFPKILGYRFTLNILIVLALAAAMINEIYKN